MPPGQNWPDWVSPALIDPWDGDLSLLFGRLGMSALLGFLVGMQREHAEGGMPGLRTFPLITLCGSVFTILSLQFGGWVLAAALLGVVALLFFPQWLRIQSAVPDPGVTTSVAVILMYGVGSLLMLTRVEVGVVLGGAVAVLLHFKPELHRLAGKFGDADLRAIMQFVLITCIILPVLPRNPIDPLGVVSPFNVWMMVVLIVGISLSAYIAYKFVGERAGVFLTGILGGAVSSTATTISAARQSREHPAGRSLAVVIILLASTVMFARVFVEMAVVNLAVLENGVVPLSLMAVATYLPVLFLRRKNEGTPSFTPSQSNPTQLRAALFFAAFYAVVLFLIAWLKESVGDAGLYPLAVLSGLQDMDAITLSISRMAISDSDLARNGWRYIGAGCLANMAAKSFLAGMMGARGLGWRMALAFLPAFITGLSLILFWP